MIWLIIPERLLDIDTVGTKDMFCWVNIHILLVEAYQLWVRHPVQWDIYPTRPHQPSISEIWKQVDKLFLSASTLAYAMYRRHFQ